MYFNENKENTNIDSEFSQKKEFSLADYKRPLIFIGGFLILLIIILIIVFAVKGKKNYFITLEGEEEITIYQGATYNEPGYSGFDNKNHDLTSEVVVKDNIDVESIGKYEVKYSLYDKTATRTIIVVERPAVTTVIHLTGDRNMTIKLGTEFKDPGYKAIDAIDGDITDKVTKTGSVKSNTKGTYRIVYSVVNSKKVTTTEVRTVTVE